jgi:hypothetical protein
MVSATASLSSRRLQSPAAQEPMDQLPGLVVGVLAALKVAAMNTSDEYDMAARVARNTAEHALCLLEDMAPSAQLRESITATLRSVIKLLSDIRELAGAMSGSDAEDAVSDAIEASRLTKTALDNVQSLFGDMDDAVRAGAALSDVWYALTPDLPDLAMDDTRHDAATELAEQLLDSMSSRLCEPPVVLQAERLITGAALSGSHLVVWHLCRLLPVEFAEVVDVPAALLSSSVQHVSVEAQTLFDGLIADNPQGAQAVQVLRTVIALFPASAAQTAAV